MEGFSWSMQGTRCWRETVTLLFTWGKIEVLSVFSLFFDRSGSVCWCKCVYTHTQAHTAREVLESEPMGRDETLPSRSEGSRWTKSRHIWTRICVHTTYTCVYILQCWEAGWDLELTTFSVQYFFPFTEKQWLWTWHRGLESIWILAT